MIMDDKAFLQQEGETDTEAEEASTEEGEMSGYTLEELEAMLKKAVESEDYERASLIRDEIKKRRK